MDGERCASGTVWLPGTEVSHVDDERGGRDQNVPFSLVRHRRHGTSRSLASFSVTPVASLSLFFLLVFVTAPRCHRTNCTPSTAVMSAQQHARFAEGADAPEQGQRTPPVMRLEGIRTSGAATPEPIPFSRWVRAWHRYGSRWQGAGMRRSHDGGRVQDP